MVRSAHMSQPPNGISICSVDFAGHMNVTNTDTDRWTDRPHYSVCSNDMLPLTTSTAIAVTRPQKESSF